ncbi:MAG: hypothetical protein PHN60_02535 [Candidatus Gracilibacteria bacterium]|nr:hypothetical protein [Candidatus Gracilibacteria bacterium]
MGVSGTVVSGVAGADVTVASGTTGSIISKTGITEVSGISLSFISSKDDGKPGTLQEISIRDVIKESIESFIIMGKNNK